MGTNAAMNAHGKASLVTSPFFESSIPNAHRISSFQPEDRVVIDVLLQQCEVLLEVVEKTKNHCSTAFPSCYFARTKHIMSYLAKSFAIENTVLFSHHLLTQATRTTQAAYTVEESNNSANNEDKDKDKDSTFTRKTASPFGDDVSESSLRASESWSIFPRKFGLTDGKGGKKNEPSDHRSLPHKRIKKMSETSRSYFASKEGVEAIPAHFPGQLLSSASQLCESLFPRVVNHHNHVSISPPKLGSGYMDVEKLYHQMCSAQTRDRDVECNDINLITTFRADFEAFKQQVHEVESRVFHQQEREGAYEKVNKTDKADKAEGRKQGRSYGNGGNGGTSTNSRLPIPPPPSSYVFFSTAGLESLDSSSSSSGTSYSPKPTSLRQSLSETGRYAGHGNHATHASHVSHAMSSSTGLSGFSSSASSQSDGLGIGSLTISSPRVPGSPSSLLLPIHFVSMLTLLQSRLHRMASVLSSCYPLQAFATAFALVSSYYSSAGISLLQSLTPTYSRCFRLWGWKGLAEYHTGDTLRAKESLERARALNPGGAEFLDTLSTVYWVRRESRPLALLAQESVEVNKGSSLTWIIVGNCFSLEQNSFQAVKFLSRAVAIETAANVGAASGLTAAYTSPILGPLAYTYTLIGSEFALMGEDSKALSAFRRALAVDSREYRGWLGLGQLYIRQDRHLLAKYHVLRSLRVNPGHATSWLLCATIHKQSADSLADEYLRDGEAAGGEDIDEFDEYASMVGGERQKSSKSAGGKKTVGDVVLRCLNHAQKLSPQNVVVRFQKACVLYEMGLNEAALDELLELKQIVEKGDGLGAGANVGTGRNNGGNGNVVGKKTEAQLEMLLANVYAAMEMYEKGLEALHRALDAGTKDEAKVRSQIQYLYEKITEQKEAEVMQMQQRHHYQQQSQHPW